jgi:hypothetical protein
MLKPLTPARRAPDRVRHCRSQRSGVTLICTLVCLAVATTLVVSSVHQSLILRRHGRMHWQLRQTEYLLDAGIRRAVSRLSMEEHYAGEVWQPSEALPGYELVFVNIAVTPLEDKSLGQKITVHARLGRTDSLAFQTQRSYSFHVISTAPSQSSPLE